MYTVYGGTIDFMYANQGIFCFSNELDTDLIAEMSPKKEGEGEGVMDMLGREENLDEMIFRDNVEMGENYTAWKSYKHPVYGDIEIGGTRKFGSRVPPLFKLAETCHRNAAFSLYHADQMPVVAFENAVVKKLDGGVFQVDFLITNAKITPTITGQAVSQKLHRPDRIRVDGNNVALLAVGEMQDRILGRTAPVKSLKNAFDVVGGVPGRGRREYRMLVKGAGTITLTFDSLKGGTAAKTIELK